jgi:hypothetical protein
LFSVNPLSALKATVYVCKGHCAVPRNFLPSKGLWAFFKDVIRSIFSAEVFEGAFAGAEDRSLAYMSMACRATLMYYVQAATRHTIGSALVRNHDFKIYTFLIVLAKLLLLFSSC